MKQFLKFTLATITGVIISSVLLFFITFAIIAGLISSAEDDKQAVVEDKTILELNLDYMIPERSSKNPFEKFDFSTMEGEMNSGLNDILKAIKGAADNQNIKGIYLHVSVSPNNYATLEEIRNALIEFKKSKKFIVAYGEMMEEHSYYLASVADKIYLNPAGEVIIDGFSYSQVYLKGLFDKLGLEPQLIRHGKYKAAGEPLISYSMSKENREQIESFTGSLYEHFINQVAAARKKTPAEVREIADKMLIQSPEDAIRLGMIDSIWYEDQVISDLKKRADLKDSDKLKLVSAKKVASTVKEASYSVKEKIAVVYANGDIISGEGNEQNIGSETFAESIRQARKDSGIKAIVLRINSPGGSALASDVIWREVVLAKKVKPVIVSMGGVAASGGYYMAAPADVIVAQPNTITGSIGVFALLMNAQKLLNEKLGVKIETVKFGEFADLGRADRPLTAAEQQIVQRYVDRIYTDFIQKVAEGRKLTPAQVDSLAQGRVWSGVDAKRLGLVDELGGLDKAISIAVKKANLKEYRITTYPKQKDPFEQLVKSLGNDAATYFTKQQLGESYSYYMMAKDAMQYEGMQARMMYSFDIH